MAAKKVWVTWLPTEEDAPKPQQALQLLGRYGLEVSGALWDDELEKAAWTELGGKLIDPSGVDVWVVAGRRRDLEDPRKRYALSLLRSVIHEGRGTPLPVVCLGLDEPVVDAGTLPLLLRDVQTASVASGTWPATVVAAGFSKTPSWPLDFRLNVIAHALIGQWFEVGPAQGDWAGVMVGVGEGARILDHATGVKGQLPERTMLEYPLEGMEVEVGGARYTACAVQNRLDPEQGYFLRVDGFPRALILGGYPGDDGGEVTVVQLG